jgi:hypothetical protein
MVSNFTRQKPNICILIAGFGRNTSTSNGFLNYELH